MKNLVLLCVFLITSSSFCQDIPARWDELNASQWPLAMEKSSKTIVLPIGILEKHGPHAPMGSDLIHVRNWVARAAEKEYAVIFPDYFYGQVNEARHLPGTFSLPSKLTMELLEATCEEIGRNGFEKILIVNGHGGNPQMLRYFVQNQMEKKRDYVVYFFEPGQDSEFQERVTTMRKSDAAGDMHAGENETSSMLYLRPDLVELDKATNESGRDQQRLPDIPNIYTAIWWYASFPYHYAGEGEKASAELGKVITEHRVSAIAEAIKAIKADTRTLEIQNQYFEEVEEMSSKN